MEIRRAHFKISAFALLLAGVARADPPRDEASLWTEFGPDLLVGSIIARRHFQKQEGSTSELLFSRRKAELPDDDEAPEAPRRRWRPEAETSEVAWRLGYAYARPTTADREVFDLDSHSGLLGIDWEGSAKNILQFSVTADFAPTLKYKGGALLFRFAHSDRAPWENARPSRGRGNKVSQETAGGPDGIPVVGKQTLHSPFGGAREEEETASEYFRRHSRIYGDPLVEHDPFDWEAPVYTAALLFEAHSHNSEASGTAQSLSQIGIGPELDLKVDESWTLGVSGRFFFYSDYVLGFLGSSPTARTYYATYPSAMGTVSGGLEGSTLRPWAFTFPDMIFEQSVSFDLDDDWSFGLNANETFYVIEGQPMGLGGTLWGRCAISPDWQLGGGGELVFNSDAVSFAGFLNLSYLF